MPVFRRERVLLPRRRIAHGAATVLAENVRAVYNPSVSK